MPTQGSDEKRHYPTYDEKDTYCISIRKLPLALAKINITPKMKRNQPELSQKLELYQDKCADVLASVFIDRQTSNINMQPIIEAMSLLTQNITALTSTITTMQQDISSLKETQQQSQKQLPKKSFSRWTSKMFPKYQLLTDYFEIKNKDLYHNLYKDLQNTYPDIDLQQEKEDFCFENNLDDCFTLDVIEHNKDLRKLFELTADNLLDKYNLSHEEDTYQYQKNNI